MSIVALQPIEWHVTPAAELLREWVKSELPRRFRKIFDILLMAGSKSNYLENKIKNEVLGAVAFNAPGTVYFGLWTTAGSLTDAFNGATANEVSGGAYDRVAVANNTTNFASVGDNVAKTNSTDITFPTATANWGTVNQVGVLDGNAKTSADNGLLWADLTTAKAVNSGDTAKFVAGDFQYNED
jgi:hypothetical protein